MRQIQLSEDDRQLATLVDEVEAGESVTILRGERPVAQIIPFPGAHPDASPNAPRTMTPQRAAAIERLRAIMNKGYDLGIEWNGRDELYDRD